MQDEELTRRIIGCAMKVHSKLGVGFLESVNEKAFAHELRKAGLQVECQVPIQVRYDDVVVGNFIADMLIERRVLVEIKVVLALSPVHEVQLVNYLTATGIEIGLLINFGAEHLEVKRKHKTYRKIS